MLVAVVGLGVVGLALNPGLFSPLVASAEAVYWQDFMPSDWEEGPPFWVLVYVNITNTGSERITGIDIPQVTIYFYNTSQLLVTLSLYQTITDYSEIGPSESILVQLQNDRETIFSPTIEAGTLLFSRVVLRWGSGNQMNLTTPPSELLYTF